MRLTHSSITSFGVRSIVARFLLKRLRPTSAPATRIPDPEIPTLNIVESVVLHRHSRGRERNHREAIHREPKGKSFVRLAYQYRLFVNTNQSRELATMVETHRFEGHT